jgi:hypothetical protein
MRGNYSNDAQKKQGVFINFSNHASNGWSEPQISAAKKIAEKGHFYGGEGQIIDIPFPEVGLNSDLTTLAVPLLRAIKEVESQGKALEGIMVQGNFPLAFFIVSLLQGKMYIPCYSAHTQRRVVEAEGKRTYEFAFEGFVPYNLNFDLGEYYRTSQDSDKYDVGNWLEKKNHRLSQKG